MNTGVAIAVGLMAVTDQGHAPFLLVMCWLGLLVLTIGVGAAMAIYACLEKP